MKGKFVRFLPIVFLGLVFLATGVLIAADVPDVITISNTGYKADKKSPVTFHHKKHSEEYKVECVACHHNYQDGKNVWKEGDPVKKCSACHDPEKKDGNKQKLQNAYHNNCKDCHKEKNDDKKAPFKKCSGCHES